VSDEITIHFLNDYFPHTIFREPINLRFFFFTNEQCFFTNEQRYKWRQCYDITSEDNVFSTNQPTFLFKKHTNVLFLFDKKKKHLIV
jgi:hypothetical protein